MTLSFVPTKLPPWALTMRHRNGIVRYLGMNTTWYLQSHFG
jgi:hypothetical protein